MSFHRDWFLASRPWSFSMSAITVGVGAALAARDGLFSWSLFALTLVGIVLMHAAANLMNDYFDVARGVDAEDVATAKYRPHPLVEGRLSRRDVLVAACGLFGLAALIGLYLTWASGPAVLVIGLAGVATGVFYTAPPVRLKYRALGELGVFFMWGPLAMEGAYYVQTGRLSLEVLLVSIPFGLLVALVLLINNVRDIAHDVRQDIRTLPMLIGRTNGVRLYVGIIAAAYLGVLLMAVFGPLSLWSFSVLASLPLASKLLGTMRRSIPDDADARTAQLNTAFGLLLLLSLVPGAVC